ncbi:hypothetical protein F8388_014340 [Cannabis sativa]|uniref:Uncharacterized protein n=1 Tax=Cannabis sativa TaxID=3483 RepID=A0A7J6ELG5_CANSA|nr:hypothetical protein F8388_014340 [Cannabis sativa]KAF4386268.1 hypothetical protein G4B88_003485 [Cannabis sativa]
MKKVENEKITFFLFWDIVSPIFHLLGEASTKSRLFTQCSSHLTSPTRSIFTHRPFTQGCHMRFGEKGLDFLIKIRET